MSDKQKSQQSGHDEPDLGSQVEELKERVRKLEEQLREITYERDSARQQLAEARAQANSDPPWTDEDGPAELQGQVICRFCQGEGVYWVHDFEMQCRRCNGTGNVYRQS